MATRMLIDARHPEETRVAVVDGNRIEEFDFEAEAHKQIRGNIYLAKVTRVEPSLQAAFIDYGGNRHGFLAFSEIHPDYYQIPKEDREALLREEQQIAEEQVEADDVAAEKAATKDDAATDPEAETDASGNGDDAPTEAGGDGHSESQGSDSNDEVSAEALRRRRMALRRRYKIQEVIRRRQVMLVQVVKEERGNKGAALTTYISLAGRYSVLMPNTAHGGGISRRISNAADRKRLKQVVAELKLPVTMGAIVRTAGLQRTKTEIKRDFDYLARLWDEIRDNTLQSTAPALIYEDSDLIKRAIRDIYNREIEEVLVDGAEGYTQARNFMRLLMPSHARRVKSYTEAVPLFHRAGVENQLAELLDPVVTLKSGGYLVINPTEALVSIDVNSGRSTREYNIEETALKTNIEAANEVARQLRLRDLAGLVVVDFIDMESHGNNRKVERALKDALKQDRARIQVGRISSFGLLEMSRQRLRTGILEASTHVCPVCEGLGLVRTDGSAALAALRLLEQEAVKARASRFLLKADTPVAVYLWNNKRLEIAELEARYGVTVLVEPDSSLMGGRCTVETSGPPPADAPRIAELSGALPGTEAPKKASSAAAADTREDVDVDYEDDHRSDNERSGRRRHGRRGTGRNGQAGSQSDRNGGKLQAASEAETADTATAATATEDGDAASASGSEGRAEKSGRRRRGRRGGQRRDGTRNREAQGTADADTAPESDAGAGDDSGAASASDDAPVADSAPMQATEGADTDVTAASTEGEHADSQTDSTADSPAPRRRRRPATRESRAAAQAQSEAAETTQPTAAADTDAAPVAESSQDSSQVDTTEAMPSAAAKPSAAADDVAVRGDAAVEEVEPQPQPDSSPPSDTAEDGADAPEPRRGWWQRTFGG